MAHLHALAPHYWNKPETANCTILIPIPSPSRRTLPDLGFTLRLHREYLSARSLFFRGLFSGVDPVQNLSASRFPPSIPLRIPPSRLPRLLPSPSSHPIVFLPVPDLSSICPLFHWMYFGNTDHIETALDKGDIHWEGLARNVEYLGLPTDMKVFLGRWYRTRHLTSHCSPDTFPCPAGEDDDSSLDSDWDGSDSDPYYSPTSPSDDDDDEIRSDEECNRGRRRDVKPLIRLCRQLRLCTV